MIRTWRTVIWVDLTLSIPKYTRCPKVQWNMYDIPSGQVWDLITGQFGAQLPSHKPTLNGVNGVGCNKLSSINYVWYVWYMDKKQHRGSEWTLIALLVLLALLVLVGLLATTTTTVHRVVDVAANFFDSNCRYTVYTHVAQHMYDVHAKYECTWKTAILTIKKHAERTHTTCFPCFRGMCHNRSTAIRHLPHRSTRE